MTLIPTIENKYQTVFSTQGMIPITFAGGTGGQFLSYLLESAKIRDLSPIDDKLSEHGNSHRLRSMHMAVAPYPAKLTYNDLLSVWHLPPENERIYPYYCGTHISEIDDVLSYFDKIIRVTYDLDDIDDLVPIFVAKRLLDDNIIPKDDIDKIKQGIATHRHFLTTQQQFFVDRPDLVPKVLCVSWKEILKYDALILIKKLSDFTEMPIEDFNYDALIAWRNATIKCMNTMKQFDITLNTMGAHYG